LRFVSAGRRFGELEVEKMKRCFLLVAMFVLLSGMTVLAQAAGEDKSKEWPYGPYDKLHGNRVEFYATADETNTVSKYIAAIKELLPQNWEVKGVINNAVPYNLGVKPDQPRGTRIELVGPSIVKGPRGINDEKESFILWIMRADYMPITPDTRAQFEEAKLLGSNDTVAVYCTSFTTGTPSWTTWKADILSRLKLIEGKRPNQ
jgi:hypothetical protein